MIAARGDGAEHGLSSGTSGPIASHDDGAIFLTAAKTSKRSDAWYDPIPTLQGAARSVRTLNDKELEVQFGQKFPKKDAESLALLASEPRLARRRAAKTTPTLASAPASITQENGGNNEIEKAMAEEP